MKTVVFLGPSLRHDVAASVLPKAVLRPPAQAGDIYRAVAHDGATTIGLIDGVFGTVPSVWHKEILFALGRGCAVFGSSSMGALRAAECAPFGMRGVGRIAALFASGELEDDDEVAIAHLGEDSAFEPVTVPMVNLRLAAAAAVDQGLVTAETATKFLVAAKSLFYADRTWERLDDELRERQLGPGAERLVLFARLPESDAKAQDARHLLEVLRTPDETAQQGAVVEAFAGDPMPEDTVFWQRLRREADFPCATPWFDDSRGGVSIQARVDVVRAALLEPDDPRLGVDARLWVHVVRMVADLLGLAPTPADVQARSETVRRELGLLDAQQTRAWLEEQRLSVREWQRSIEFLVTAEMLGAEFSGELRAHVPLLVALHGGWAEFADYAERDRDAEISTDDESAALERLVATQRLPDAPTLDSLASRLGFTSLTEFIVTVVGRRPYGPAQ